MTDSKALTPELVVRLIVKDPEMEGRCRRCTFAEGEPLVGEQQFTYALAPRRPPRRSGAPTPIAKETAMPSTDTVVRLTLSRRHVGRILDGIEVLIEPWDSSAAWFRTGEVGDIPIRECSDADPGETAGEYGSPAPPLL